ncbi:hypothetical protein [Rhizobium sp. PP-CC-3G-465]|uniref:hypothetical protein n=1 Tax=Rhizobium sp. PP-CC-3G-465 TaxID=2135648 RepID=UPI0010452F7D|nr:hypothetical protein C8J33_1011984 [Rhizobium sp. PP-CC-3G-465]
MTPKRTTIENEREQERWAKVKQVCDVITERALLMMVNDAGAPVAMALDRLLTYAIAQACKIDGSPKAAEALRQFAAKVDGGLFHSITGEDKPTGRGH